mgnify:CR=1 FL=1
MEILLYTIVFLLLLVVSNVTNRLLPQLPLPLVQIVLGISLGFLLPQGKFHLDTELFLALVIGPLLFREAEESNITSILKHWRIILYLIFPVIFISTLGLGYLAHLLWAALPLAACIAVGAALGPTDLVAFASLSERFSFPKRVENILKGEGLLNDASGLVAFRVALLAWTTGSFSLGKASISLVLSIIGGFAVGMASAALNRWLHKLLMSAQVSDIASELLLELSLPLVTFFLAEEIHVSGIIAVVVAGIFKASRFKRITLLEAQVDSVTETIWNTVNFMLNGSVFIILGIELEMIAEPILKSPIYDNLLLLVSIVLLTFLLFALRFVMLFTFYFIRIRRLHKKVGNYLKEMLLLTFSGVKGTVSIATILLIPSQLEQAFEEGKISDRSYHLYQRYLHNIEQGINRNLVSRFIYMFLVTLRVLRMLLHEIVTLGARWRSWRQGGAKHLTAEDMEDIAELYLSNTEVIIESLEHLKGIYKPSLITFLQESRLRETEIIGSGAFIERVIARFKPNNISEMIWGYYLERKIIFEYEKKKLISSSYAKRLRQNVNNLENYSLKERANTLPYDMVNYARGH